jgi:hypothetical protein
MARKIWTGVWLILAVFVTAITARPGEPAPLPKQSFRDPRAQSLKAAITSSNLDRVRQLVGSAATDDCLELDEQGRTALHYAVQRCAEETGNANAFDILKLLAFRPGCVNASDRLGRKPILDVEPLSWTSRSRMDALNVLISAGADISAQDENGATLLHQLLSTWDASSQYLPEVLGVLIAAKLQPNIADSAGQTPLHYFFGAHGFCSDREGSRATKLAAAQKVFTTLVGAGADITLKDREGTTPFGMLLMQYETHFGTKEYILSFAAPALAKLLNVNAARIKDRPALIAVCDKGQCDPALVERLLELGADPKTVEDDGFTALHGAAWFYNYFVCGVLLEGGANVNAVTQKGRTPLHELVRSKYFDSAFLESDRGANILKAAEVLIVRGADRKLKDTDGKTALDLFKMAGGGAAQDADIARAMKKRLKP